MNRANLHPLALCVLLAILCMLAGTAFADDACTIVFNPNDRDAALTQIELPVGSKVERPADPVRADHSFTGWYIDKRAEKHPFDFDSAISDDLFLYAGWTSEKVRVSLDWNDGSPVTSVSVDGGTVLDEEQLPEVPARENYVFTAWYTDAGCTTAFDQTKALMKNMTLYAGWQQLQATVSFDLGYFGAEDTPAAQTLELTQGEKATAPAEPVRGEAGDYRFEGWYTGMGKEERLFDFDAEVTGDVALHANWTQLRFSVTFDMNGADLAPNVERVAMGAYAVAVKASREGYDFLGWFYDKDCTIQADLAGTALTGDTTVYAGWAAQARTITYHYNYDGAPEDETASTVYDAVMIEPDEPVREGDSFIGWFYDAAQTQPASFGSALKGNLDLYAGWESVAATAEAPSAEEDELVTADGKFILRFYMNDGTATVYAEETVAKNKYSDMRKNGVTYPEREGYTATGWYTTADCTQDTEFNPNIRVTSGMKLYVKWRKTYVFEAELTQLTQIPIEDSGKTEDKLGYGESSNPKGLYLIEWDCYDAGASNSYYISYLYNPGTYLEFCITAAQDVTEATLVLRLTPELHDMYFATGGPDGTAAEKNGYKVYVDPVYSFNSVTNTYALEAYDQMYVLGDDLTGAVTKDEDPGYTRKRAFADYTVTTILSLHAGDNVIRLVTDNTHDYGGSMHSAAPMVDCIKILTDVELSWTQGREYTSNLVGIDVRWPEKNQ